MVFVLILIEYSFNWLHFAWRMLFDAIIWAGGWGHVKVLIQKQHAYSYLFWTKELNLFEITTINYQTFNKWWKAQHDEQASMLQESWRLIACLIALLKM